MRRVLFSAGEASGDAYGARLAVGLRAMHPNLPIAAIGGPKLRQAGAEMIADSSKWGAISFVESFKVGFSAYSGYVAGLQAIRSGPPGLFIPIDFGFMNIKLAWYAKRHGWRVVYFIPPGSWNRQKQGSDIPKATDVVVTPFDWSAKMLNEMGANAFWFGHPLQQLVKEASQSRDHREGIALLVGSRKHEVDIHLPILAAASKMLPGPFVFGLAPTVQWDDIQSRWHALGGGPCEFEQGSVAALSRCRAALVCSGTATLEAAICGCPMVVFYRGTRLMEFEYRVRRPKISSVSLPNILADEHVLPELLLEQANAENLAKHLLPLLDDTPQRETQMVLFERLKPTLGPDNAIDQTLSLLSTELGLSLGSY